MYWISSDRQQRQSQPPRLTAVSAHNLQQPGLVSFCLVLLRISDYFFPNDIICVYIYVCVCSIYMYILLIESRAV